MDSGIWFTGPTCKLLPITISKSHSSLSIAIWRWKVWKYYQLTQGETQGVGAITFGKDSPKNTISGLMTPPQHLCTGITVDKSATLSAGSAVWASGVLVVPSVSVLSFSGDKLSVSLGLSVICPSRMCVVLSAVSSVLLFVTSFWQIGVASLKISSFRSALEYFSPQLRQVAE